MFLDGKDLCLSGLLKVAKEVYGVHGGPPKTPDVEEEQFLIGQIILGYHRFYVFLLQ